MTPATPNRSKSRLLQAGWLTVILIALSAAVGQAFGRFSYGVLLPAVRDDLGISNTLAGLIGGANVGAYLLGTLLVAWATSHYRLINVMRAGLVLATLGLLLASLSSSPWLLAMALFVAGIGGALLWIPAPVIAADALPPSQRRIAVSVMSSGIGLGIMFVSILSGSLRSSQGDGAWSEVYQIQFIIGLVLLALVLLIVRHQQPTPSGGAGIGGFSALQRMPGWLPVLVAYSTFGFMYLLVLGFLTTRLEDDSLWTTRDAASAFTAMGFAMIFGGPIFVTLAQKIGVRLALATAFGLWPICVGVVITGYPAPTLIACIGLGFLFSALPTLITLYVVENTTAKDYGPSFAAATLAFGIAQTISPPVGGYIADLTGSFTLVFLLAALMSSIGLLAALQLPRGQP
jgi:predicted MFS family arabinose efflux permease|tara:strand:+ start:390 stop:1595 length:1206 start_codon:yes stop_codon:yes gene_type:complete